MLHFKEFLNIEPSQAEEAHEPTQRASSSVLNPIIQVEINSMLDKELMDGLIQNPQAGIQKIRKVIHRFGMDMPALSVIWKWQTLSWTQTLLLLPRCTSVEVELGYA